VDAVRLGEQVVKRTVEDLSNLGVGPVMVDHRGLLLCEGEGNPGQNASLAQGAMTPVHHSDEDNSTLSAAVMRLFADPEGAQALGTMFPLLRGLS